MQTETKKFANFRGGTSPLTLWTGGMRPPVPSLSPPMCTYTINKQTNPESRFNGRGQDPRTKRCLARALTLSIHLYETFRLSLEVTGKYKIVPILKISRKAEASTSPKTLRLI